MAVNTHDLLQFLRQHHQAALDAHLNATLAALRDQWQPARAVIAERIAQLEDAMQAAQDAGQVIDPAWLAMDQRLTDVLQSIDDAAQGFADGAQQTIGEAQLDALAMAQEDAQDAMSAALPDGTAVTFGVPPQDVLDAAASALDDDSPLAGVFSEFGADASASASQALFSGITLGQSAAQIAEMLAQATEMPMQRAEVIARTELLGAYRDAQMANYRANSDVVTGWMWSASFNERTCFPAGTRIQTRRGRIAIERVRVGDEVLTHTGAYKAVRETMWRDYDGGMMTVQAGEYEATATFDHPFLVARRHGVDQLRKAEWIEAHRIQLDDLAVCQMGRASERPNELFHGYPVTSLETSHHAGPVYNLTVEGDHTYVADGFVVHNCGACLAMDGTIHPLDEDLSDHVCGRCAALPITQSYSDILGQLGFSAESAPPDTSIAAVMSSLDHQIGREWLADQDFATQSRILGPAKAAAVYKYGDASLLQVVGIRRDAVWGDSIYERSLKEMGLNYRDYLYEMHATSRIGQVVEEASALQDEERLAQMARDLNLDEPLERASTLAETAYTGPVAEYVAKVDATLDGRLTQYATLHPDMSVDEYKAAVSEHLQGLLSGDIQASVRIPSDALDKALTDGRLKTSHELTDLLARGQSYQDTREAFERDAFGYDIDTPLAQLPISGYITQAGQDSGAAQWYGDARLVLKPEALERATASFGDSLDGDLIPRPVGDMTWDAYNFPALPERDLATMSEEARAQYESTLAKMDPLSWDSIKAYGAKTDLPNVHVDMYVEAQVHGGVSLGDIQQVIFTGEQPDAALLQRLDDAGITWSHEPQPDYLATLGRTPETGEPLEHEAAEAAAHVAETAPSEAQQALAAAQARVETLPVIRDGNAAEADMAAFHAFGRDLSDDELRSLVGAPDDATVTIKVEPGGLVFNRTAAFDAPMFSMVMTGPNDEYEAERVLWRAPGGTLYMENRSFHITKDLQGQGLGAQVFSDQVEALSKMGVSHIETWAQRDAESVGYYTWPRFGYVGKLYRDTLDKIGEAVATGGVPAEWANFTAIEELMQTKAGRDWWKANGESLSLKFNLAPDSLSMRTLQAYLDEKATLTEAATAAERIAPDAFSIERLPAEQLAQESQRALDALHPPVANPNDPWAAASEAKARVSAELGARLADNPDFAQVAQTFYDQEKAYLEGLSFYTPERVAEELARFDLSPEETASRLLGAWAGGDRSGAYAGLQQAIKDEFGLSGLARMPRTKDNLADLAVWKDAQAGLRAYVRAMYDNTQDWLRANDITEMPLYRAAGWEMGRLPKAIDPAIFDGEEHEIQAQLRAASSFTIDAETAARFSNMPPFQEGDLPNWSQVIAARVPAELILATPQTGFGSLDEFEAVVLGGKYDALMVGVDNTAFHTVPFEDLVSSAVTKQYITADQVTSLLTAPEAATTATETEAATGEVSGAAREATLPTPDETAFATARATTGYTTSTAEYTLTDEDKAFVTDLKDSIAQAKADGPLDHTDAISIGAQLHDRISADLADLSAYADEARQMYQLGPQMTDEMRAWTMGDKDAMAAHGGITWTQAQAMEQAAYQARVTAYLDEVRGLGGVDVSFADAGADAKFDQAVADAVTGASDRIPSDWLQASNDLGDLTTVRDRERSSVGWFLGDTNGGGALAVQYNRDTPDLIRENTALHEMMHRMEQVYPEIGQLEQQFYDYRTAGDAFVDLTNGVKQRTKLDQWVDEYLGREPLIQRRPSFADLTYGFDRQSAPSYELLSVGAEALLGGAGNGFDLAALRQDREYISFVLGLFATIGGDEGAAVASVAADVGAAEEASAALGEAERAGETAFSAAPSREPPWSAEDFAAALEAPVSGNLGGLNPGGVIAIDDTQYYAKQLSATARIFGANDVASQEIQAQAEVTATNVADALGLGDLVTPTYMTTDANGAPWVVARMAPDGSRDLLYYTNNLTGLRAISDEQFARATLLNYALGEADPNAGNLLVLPDDTLLSLDHSASLGAAGDMASAVKFDASVTYWRMKVLSAPTLALAGLTTSGYDLLKLDPGLLADIASREDAVVALMQANGLESGVAALRDRFAILRQLAELDSPTVQDLIDATT